ncbi:MAG: mu-protocadherin-cell-suface protein [Chthoniobacteraceae bacterium]
MENARNDRQDWRDMNREDWQDHREELWDYRGDRAEEVWDNARDFYDDVFDDHWWGAAGWGGVWVGNYPSNPWWWWAPAAIGTVATFVDGIVDEPVYVDYGMNVVYEGDTVYVNNEPVPAEQYYQPVIDLAVNVEQPPPPLPPEEPAVNVQPAAATPAAAPVTDQQEWLPLGVYALAQEEKGDPVMFFQISVNRDGIISGAYTSTITDDQRPVAGQIDKKTQRAAWRIGENTDTIFESSLGNLTQDVSPVAIHFGGQQTQTWLLVRMPEPPPAGQEQKLPTAPTAPPPLKVPPKAK